MSPLEAIRQWYHSLNEEDRSRVALIVGSSLPTESVEHIFGLKDSTTEFEGWMAQQCRSAHQELGRVLALRELIKMLIVRKSDTVEAWAETRAFFESTAASDNASMVEKSKKALEELPEKTSRWISICNEWKELCEGPLSDTAILEWYDDAEYADILRINEELRKPRTINLTARAVI
jgi:hypothetical protein